MNSSPARSASVISGCQQSIISTYRSLAVGFPVEWTNEVSTVKRRCSSQCVRSFATSIQQPSGILIPRMRSYNEVSIITVWLHTWPWSLRRAKQTPLTASGISSSFKSSYVFGNSLQFSRFHTPSLCNRIADHPPPITVFCKLLSQANTVESFFIFAVNSSWMMYDFSSKACAHDNSFVSQRGLAVNPSICSSEGSWYSL